MTRPTARALWLAVGFLAVFIPFRIATLEGWDDAFYMAQLTSLAGDGDLLLQDDLLAFPNPPDLQRRTLTTILESGALHNTFSIGPAVLHSAYTWPLLGTGAAKAGEWRVLRLVLAVGAMVILVLTVLLTAAALRRLGIPDGIAALCAGLAVVAGPLAIYGTRVHLGSHLPSAFWAAAVLLALVLWLEKGGVREGAMLGLTAGFLVINRWQDAVILAGLAPAGILALAGKERLRERAAGLLAGAAFFLAAVALQLLAWRLQFGSMFLMPQGGGYMRWTRPNLVPLLFSGYHGLVPWMPGFALGLAGLALLKRSFRGLTAGLLLAVAASIYVSSCPEDWWGRASYGPRRLSALTPLAALGLALVFVRLRPVARGVLAACVLGSAVFTASAHMSHVEDLTAFLFGRPDPFVPAEVAGEPAPEFAWINRWGPLHYLKPGFTFSDTPGNPDRILGAATTAAVVLATWGLWSLLRRSRWGPAIALIAGGVWIPVCGIWLLRAPPNAPWDGAWREVVRGPCPDPSRLAPSMVPAARAVCGR